MCGVAAEVDEPVNTMWRILHYAGFEACFGSSTVGAGTETHLESICCLCAILILYNVVDWLVDAERRRSCGKLFLQVADNGLVRGTRGKLGQYTGRHTKHRGTNQVKA